MRNSTQLTNNATLMIGGFFCCSLVFFKHIDMGLPISKKHGHCFTYSTSATSNYSYLIFQTEYHVLIVSFFFKKFFEFFCVVILSTNFHHYDFSIFGYHKSSRDRWHL